MADVSVIVPSYNHDRYVVDAVKCVLRQSVSPKEVIVVDDGSRDDSVQRLRRLSDSRLRLVVQPENRGGSETLNVGIRASECELIAICNSDDLWEPDKLERQLDVLEKDPELAAVFSNVTWIGEFGESVAGYGPAFEPGNRTRHGWLRHLVENGNCLCHSSVLIRREAYRLAGEYDNRLRQLPDFNMWLSVVSHLDIHVLEDKLVRFRVHHSTSTPSPATSTRDRNEFSLIVEGLMDRIDQHNFCLAFGSRLHPSDPRFDLDVEKFIYLWTADGLPMNICRSIACRLAMRLLGSRDGEEAWRRYGFSMSDFHVLHGITSPWLSVRDSHEVFDNEVDVLARVFGRRVSQHRTGQPPGERPPQGQVLQEPSLQTELRANKVARAMLSAWTRSKGIFGR